jgi:AraC-like DNA-binding protein
VHVLGAGGAVLLPRGGAHDLVSAPALSSRDVTTFETAALCDTVYAISACPEETCRIKDALVFSGCMEFDLGGMNPLVALMPEVMLVDTLLDRQPEIEPMLRAMEREVRTERAGSAGILARLADVVSASIVRGWVECGCGDATGWVEALRDPRLGRAIGALHRDPGRNWTVSELAAEMGSSRSVFAERFQAVTGQTPLRYVTELRMRLAAEWIGRDRMPIDAAAQRLGYASQAAFSRAFKRVTGQSPGAVRAPRLPQIA